MDIDLEAARSFMAMHARQLDRRRLEAVLGHEPHAVLDAVAPYRNADGGYGWGLEPDLRSRESQPGGALHAFEAFADAAPHTTPHAAELCNWAADVALPGGALPFALPMADPAGVAPFWSGADPASPSLQITAYVAGAAHRVARFDEAVAAHPWLHDVTEWLTAAIAALPDEPHALAVVASLSFLDAAGDPGSVIEAVRPHVPADGILRVAGGADDEAIRPLDLSPLPHAPSRGLLGSEVVDADLRRLASQQQPDGGWRVDFDSYSPAAALEWRGHATVRAVSILHANWGSSPIRA